MGVVRLRNLLGVLAAVSTLGTGCVQAGLGDPMAAAELDDSFFRCNVQPVIAARCAFFECHGSAQRPYSLYAVQRLRLEVPWDEQATPLTGDELRANLDASIGFVGDGTNSPQLLAKPLDTDVGGFYHRGKDLYGDKDVFLSADDLGYQLLGAWIGGAVDDLDCEPTMEVGL